MIALLYIERKIKTNESRVFVSSMIDGKQHKARELDTVTSTNHAPRHTWRNYPWPWLSLKRLVSSAAKWRQRRWFRKLTARFRPIGNEIVSSMYNNHAYMKVTRHLIQDTFTFPLHYHRRCAGWESPVLFFLTIHTKLHLCATVPPKRQKWKLTERKPEWN